MHPDDEFPDETAPGQGYPPAGAPTPPPRGAKPRKPGEQEVHEDLPAAGPHAKPELTNELATPGTGSLPEPGANDDVDAPSS
jgi:hypothetical protein